ncbi:MAG: lytic transglycosylase domain-containing protein [Anaerolineae bacterium]|nr:lytic transglycosylase domain-containing protein [Anaerolineae bacterium]
MKYMSVGKRDLMQSLRLAFLLLFAGVLLLAAMITVDTSVSAGELRDGSRKYPLVGSNHESQGYSLIAPNYELQNPALSSYWHTKVQRWGSLIVQEAQRRTLDPDFLAALVWMESRGEANAVGPAGAVGLMQIMPKEAGFSWRPTQKELVDPETNLFWGTRTLATIIRQGHGDIFNALAAYNGGWEQVGDRAPRYFATTILRDYAQAVVERTGVEGRWIAYFAVWNMEIQGPIWVADSARTDVYFYGKCNWLLDGENLIPAHQPPTTIIAYYEYIEIPLSQEIGVTTDVRTQYAVGFWLYSVAQRAWISTSVIESAPPTPTSTPTVLPETPLSPSMSPTPTPTAIVAVTSDAAEVMALVLEEEIELRSGASKWWWSSDTLPSGTLLQVVGYDPDFPEWVYVRTSDGEFEGWTQIEGLEVKRDLHEVPLMTPLPTLTPTPETSPTPTPTPTPICDGGPLWGEAWTHNTVSTPNEGWKAYIFVRGNGGNCFYTYAWNTLDNVIAGPTSNFVLYEIVRDNRDHVILGTMLITSGDETVSVPVYVEPPPK